MPEDDVMKQTIEAALRDAESTARLGANNQLNEGGRQALSALLNLINADIAEAAHDAAGDGR
jgi:hypothetical protein